jgi:hypothetical protein
MNPLLSRSMPDSAAFITSCSSAQILSALIFRSPISCGFSLPLSLVLGPDRIPEARCETTLTTEARTTDHAKYPLTSIKNLPLFRAAVSSPIVTPPDST